MIVLFVILFVLFACSLHRRERFVLTKQRSDVLKALFFLHFYVLSLQRTKGIDYEIFGSQG